MVIANAVVVEYGVGFDLKPAHAFNSRVIDFWTLVTLKLFSFLRDSEIKPQRVVQKGSYNVIQSVAVFC